MRYKIVACVLLILPVFSFVLAAPIPVREVREICADAVEGGENVIFVSGKRAPRVNPCERAESDSSDTVWWGSPSQSSSARDGSYSGVDMPSFPSSGSESPMWSKTGSTPGGTGVSFDAKGAVTPETTTENQPASPSKPKSVSWGPTTNVHFYDESVPPHIPGPDGKLQDHLPLPPGREGYLAKVTAQQLPPQPQPQSKGFVSKFKTFFGKLGRLSFRPRKVPA